MSSTVTYTYLDTGVVGRVLVAWSADGLVAVNLGTELSTCPPKPEWHFDENLHCAATEQLRAYFDGKRKEFDLPLVLDGTPFQEKVWRALAEIPYGRTVSYGQLAKSIGSPKAVRAVGAANGRNPLPIVLPCHRVIGSDGKLHGYAGGLDIKAALLDLERGVQTFFKGSANEDSTGSTAGIG